MEPGRAEQLEYILGNVAVGVAILDPTSLRILYANSYLRSLLDKSWSSQDLRQYSAEEVIAPKCRAIIIPLLRQVAACRVPIRHSEVPYEGFLESRGRTYWRVAVEYTSKGDNQDGKHSFPTLLITIEDVTTTVRSRLHLNAIHYISSAIAGPSSLHLVLERILQALHEMVGSKRCAIFLMDQSPPSAEIYPWRQEETSHLLLDLPHNATMAAQHGIHQQSQDWHPQVNEHTLLGRAMSECHTIIITDTSTTPEIELPLLNKHDLPCRPGSVLCVPIFEPRLETASTPTLNEQSGSVPVNTNTVLGTIEVYHRRARGFPTEEVELLERFAQQAGLAIQNARLFRSIDHLARVASHQARQKKNIMQAIPDSVVIYDPSWHIIDMNHAARTLFGWSDDVIGLPTLEALKRSSATFQPDFAQTPNLIATLELRALQGQTDEFKIIGANSQVYTMSCTYTPIRDDLGDIFAFLTIYHDVTEEVAARVRIEAEVIERTAEIKQRNAALLQAKAAQDLTNARMALLLKYLPSGVILVNARIASITLINRQAVQILQSLGAALEPLDDPDEAGQRAIDLNCEQLLRPLPARTTNGTLFPYEEQPLHQTLMLGKTSEAELQMVRTDGQAISLLVNTTPLRTHDGTVTSAILVFQDITRIKTLERAREDFFTTMAHELKTPLANIRAHLSALLARDLQWSSEEQYDFLQTADEQVERLVGMINHFLDASRVEAGALRLALEPIFIPELIEDLQDRLAALITSSDRRLQINLPSPLPAVVGDYELIISVLTNLLSNAFRYAPVGDAVQLSATPLSSEHYPQQMTAVKLSVADRGSGISLEQQATLFTRFSTFAAMHRPSIHRPGQPVPEWPRRMSTLRWSPTTGLGLYISQGILEAHGSKLTLMSNPGQGTIFTFTLPVFKGKTEQNHQAQADKSLTFFLKGE
jgi:PAS domain S-box-containing protein